MILALAAPAGAQSIGVASISIGDPLGKPPAEAERVLRVGIDLQAGELVTTGADDRCHLLFLDGTALTVGPRARLTLDKFVYDKDRKLGALSLSATQGTFRLVGGKISKAVPITVTTPSSTLTIRGGIMMFEVQPTTTTATFLFGYEMTVTSLGQTRSVTTPGWQVTSVAGHFPSMRHVAAWQATCASSRAWASGRAMARPIVRRARRALPIAIPAKVPRRVARYRAVRRRDRWIGQWALVCRARCPACHLACHRSPRRLQDRSDLDGGRLRRSPVVPKQANGGMPWPD
jgi:hypothetical protein